MNGLYENPDGDHGYERLATWRDAKDHRVELFRLASPPATAP
jgi:hypothetical protein